MVHMVGRPGRHADWQGRLHVRRGHALEDVLVRDDFRAFPGVSDLPRHVAAGNLPARRPDLLVAAGMIGIGARY